MMTNGTLQYKTHTGGGLLNGDPIPVVEAWSEPIEALIIPSGSARLTKYQDGEQVAASYTVHLESQDFSHDTIRITDDRGTNLGEYQVLRPNIAFFDISGRVKITV